MTPNGRNTSFGGQVVQQSLAAAGFEIRTPHVSLVETARPTVRYDAILVQSAWNIIPRSLFNELMAPYPPRMRRRAQARRVVARANLRRSERVVCFTLAVAEVLNAEFGVQAVVAPVTIPIHDWREPVKRVPDGVPFAFVPGTVTWYKQPLKALDWLSENTPDLTHVVFCGVDDGSGCWEEVLQQADLRGYTVERICVPHDAVYEYYANAALVILPSILESLGFGLTEALLHGSRVVASAIPTHMEISSRTGVNAEWLVGPNDTHRPASTTRTSRISFSEATSEWASAAQALGLTQLATRE